MIRTIPVLLMILAALSGPTIPGAAQELTQTKWVPLVARLVEEHDTNFGRPMTLVLTGVYVRNADGSYYQRSAVTSNGSGLPLVGQTDHAILYDRPSHTMYFIDFARKTAKELGVDVDRPELAAQPMSAADFDRERAADQFLGKQTISGVECEGYKIHDPRHKNKYVSEVWYAPSLNYFAVKAKTRVHDQDVTNLFRDIQAGRESDPAYFRLPEGFKMIK